MTPRPPTSTLFPYTTLFRSHAAQAGGPCAARQLGALALGVFRRQAGRIIGRQVLRQQQRQDRKSTRLNSSHITISYAVFCLKKKTKKTTIHAPANKAYLQPN